MPLCYGARVIGVVAISKLGVEPVRRGRRAAARGAGRPRVGRARERAPVRGAAARGRPPEGAARVHRRDLRGGHARRDRRRDGPRGRADPGRQEMRALAAGRERRLPDQRALRTTRTTRRLRRCSASCSAKAICDDDRRAHRAVPARRADEADRALHASGGRQLARPGARAAAQRRRARGLHLRPRADRRQRAHGRRDPAPARRHLLPGGASRWSAPAATRTSRRPSSRPSRRWRTRSRRTTSTPRRTRAGSPTWRCASAGRWASRPPS